MTNELTGLALREAVATEVFGFGLDARGYWHNPAMHTFIAELPHYESDIAAAWLVVEKIQSRGWKVGVEWFNDKLGTWAWACCISDAKHYSLAWERYASAPEAICRAALAAIRSQE